MGYSMQHQIYKFLQAHFPLPSGILMPVQILLPQDEENYFLAIFTSLKMLDGC